MLSAKRPALLFMNARGDHLLNLPAIRALTQLFPGALRLVCRTGARATYFPYLDFQTVHEVESRCRNLQYDFDAERVATELGDTDLFICLNPIRGDSSGELMRLLGAPPSVGFDPAFSTYVPVDYSIHSADLAFRVVRALSPQLRIEDYARPLELLRSETSFAASLVGALPPDHALVVVHPDSKPDKMWDWASWRALLERLLRNCPRLTVLDVGLEQVDARCEACADRIIS